MIYISAHVNASVNTRILPRMFWRDETVRHSNRSGKAGLCSFDVLDQLGSFRQPKVGIARYSHVGPVCMNFFVISIKCVSLPYNVLNQSNWSKKKHHQ